MESRLTPERVPDPELEREAEETARRVMNGGELGIQRLSDTDVHVQRIADDKMFEALALFDTDDETGEVSDHRQRHNDLQFGHLYDIAQTVIERNQRRDDLETKQALAEGGDPAQRDLADRFDSVGSIRADVEALQREIDDDLDDVALTDDQRRRLYGLADTDNWDKVGWGLTKTILTATGLPALLEMVNLATQVSGGDAATGASLGSKAVGRDIDQMGTQAVAKARRGRLGWEEVKRIWTQSNGTLEERAEQIEQEIREGTFLTEDGQDVGRTRGDN
ncbi:hypothetical protein RYH80_03130 [Halobaculum sp. MBLA0147]|uniref:hypothetical protein n=1 Tax=Halobaculum sp. MBLA0147 TaxID=3079934 RepID=UPI003524FB30